MTTHAPFPATIAEARPLVQALQAELLQRGLVFRAPPPEPTACCGRGCNGCVWEGYYTALQYWHEQATSLLNPDAAVSAPPQA